MNDAMDRRCVSQARFWRAIRPVSRLGSAVLVTIVFFFAASDSKQNPSDAGVLSVQTSGGLIVIGEPDRHLWFGSFGSYFLCTTTGRGITIREIRYETPVRPVDVSLWLREVRANTSSIISARGKPPNFIDPDKGSSFDMGGKYKVFHPGLRVTRPCAKSGKGSYGFTELLFVVKVDGRGGVIRQAWIDYAIDGDPGHRYTLDLNWVMVLCGDEVHGIYDQDSCSIDS